MAMSVASSAAAPTADAKARDEIIDALAAWRDAANAGDRVRSIRYFTTDAISDFPPRPAVTYAEMKQRLGNPPGQLWNTEFKVLEVMADGALGVVRVEFTSRAVQADGSLGNGEKILTTQIWRKEPDGQWRIARTLSGLIHRIPQ
jgi:ketosteroid isomerase-like protein